MSKEGRERDSRRKEEAENQKMEYEKRVKAIEGSMEEYRRLEARKNSTGVGTLVKALAEFGMIYTGLMTGNTILVTSGAGLTGSAGSDIGGNMESARH